MLIQRCDMCRKVYDINDTENRFGIRHQFGYGSVHDGDELMVDLCCECADKLTTFLIENCVDGIIKERF